MRESIDGNHLVTFADAGDSTHNPELLAKVQELDEVLNTLQNPDGLVTPDQINEATDTISMLLENPDQRGDVLADLISSPEYQPIMEELQHRDLSSDLDRDTLQDLLAIQQELDEQERLTLLGKYVADRVQIDAKIEQLNSSDVDGKKAAVEFLRNMDSEQVIPRLQQAGIHADPETKAYIEATIRSIVTGEPPDLDFELIAEGNPQSVPHSPIPHGPDEAILPDRRPWLENARRASSDSNSGGGDGNSPPDPKKELDKLASSDPRQVQSAMQMLYDWPDDEIVNTLNDAKVEADPETKDRINEIIDKRLSGEPLDQADITPPYSNPSDGDLSTLDNNTVPNGAVDPNKPLLDVERLESWLSNPETAMDALNAVVQIGQPAISPLCEILLRAK